MITTSSSRMAAGLGVDNSGEIWLPYQYCRDLHRLQHRETLQNTKGTAYKTRVPDCNLLTFSVGQEADVYVRSVRLRLQKSAGCTCSTPISWSLAQKSCRWARTRSQSCRTSRHCPPRSISTSVWSRVDGLMDGRKDLHLYIHVYI